MAAILTAAEGVINFGAGARGHGPLLRAHAQAPAAPAHATGTGLKVSTATTP